MLELVGSAENMAQYSLDRYPDTAFLIITVKIHIACAPCDAWPAGSNQHKGVAPIQARIAESGAIRRNFYRPVLRSALHGRYLVLATFLRFSPLPLVLLEVDASRWNSFPRLGRDHRHQDCHC